MTKRLENIDLKFIIIVILLIIIIILLLCQMIGKIGYIDTSTNSTQVIEVTQNDIGWELLEELSIFDNIKYDLKPIIYPGIKGEYSFIVSNTTNQKLIYDIQLKDINKYGINMKYRLKLENIYISGDENTWKDLEDINVENIIVAPNSSNIYTLEWCWVNNDEKDTMIGSLDYADYLLRIKIGAQMYDKNVGDN